jgi:ABC-type polysaccharide/polyol phosphate export permease
LANLLRAMVTHHELLRQLVARDLQLKYRGSALGYFWTLLEPLSLVLTYHFFFTLVVGWRQPHYFLLVLLGVLPYSFFSGLLQSTTRALTADAQILRKVFVPRQVLVLARALSQLVMLGLTALVAVPVLAYHQVLPGRGLLLTLSATLLLLLLGTGLGLIASCAAVRYRDVEYALSALLRIAFFLAPVAYPLERVPPSIRDLYLWNPLAVLVHLFRYGMLDGSLDLSAAHTLAAVLFSLGVFVAGCVVFERWQHQVVKYL